jgi:ligand-binding SRPBCC domain-containing protein
VSSDVAIARHGNGFKLTTSVHVPGSLENVFSFFADAYQLQSITPDWLHFKILTPAPIPMETGTLIDYQIRLHGIPLRWRTRISLWEPPFRFIDEQLRGPYRVWRHLHTFEADGDETIVRDEVEYAVPGGRLIHRFFVQGDLERIFRYRQTRLLQIFEHSGNCNFSMNSPQ